MKRTLSFLLTLLMLVTSLPLNAFIALAQELTAETQATAVSVDSFRGKTVSILSHSASTYDGVSNNTADNSTIGKNDVYYTEGRHGVYREDTWWQQVIDVLDMRLLVNNSWSGSCVLQPRKGEASVAYKDRAVNLHNDHTGEEPDIIWVYIGGNDFAYYKDTYGKAADVDYDALIKANGDGSYTYAEPTTTCEAYAITLHKAATRYPEAEIYCITSTARREVDYTGDSYPDAGQPTEYSAQLWEVAAHFGYPVVDLEKAIPKDVEIFDSLMGDKRAHPNAEGMDRISEELLSVMLGREVTLQEVTGEYDGVTTDHPAAAAITGDAYKATLTPEPGYSNLHVTVTMGGEDITQTAYADGKITVSKVTGDLVITAKADRKPLHFRWEMEGTSLRSVGDENALAALGGTVTDGVITGGRYQAAIPMVLKHDRPWVLEWRCGGDWRGAILTSAPITATVGKYYLSRTKGGQLCFGAWSGSQYDNYGVDLSALDAGTHTFRLENRISADGSNMIYLSLDGGEALPMNNYFVGSKAQNTTSNWVSGKDFSFGYLGTNSAPLNDCKLEYLLVCEDTSLSLSYDDRYDVSGKEVEIIDAGKPTSYQVGYGVAEGTLDTAVITLDGGKLIATGIGTAKVKIDGVTYTVTVKAAPISLLLLIGQSNMRGSEGDPNQSIVCPDGMVYSTYGDDRGASNTAMTVNNATSFAPSALAGPGSLLNVNGNTDCLGGYPLNSLTAEGAGRMGPDSGFAYEWVKQTGEKVWVVNAAHGGTSITTWQKGKANYEEALLLFGACQETLKKEIAAGHYTLSHMGYFWCQGCSDRTQTAKWYVEKYLAMHENLKKDLAFDEDTTFEFGGIIPVRVGSTAACYRDGVQTATNSYAYHESFVDLRMNGPRVAQYWMINNPALSDIWGVCNIGDDWVWMPDGTNGVEAYFNAHYENGRVDYTTQVAQKESWYTPTTPKAVHDSIHYNQIGYNEIGRESVRNALILLGVLEAPEVEPAVEFVSWDGFTPVESINANTTPNSETLVVPVVSPIWKSKEVTYSLSDSLTWEYYDLLAVSDTQSGTLSSPYTNQTVTVSGHAWSAWETVFKPTPEGAGQEKRVCADCGLIQTRVLKGVWQLYDLASHMQTMPEEYCKDTNLWAVLEHDPYYFASGTKWGIHSSREVPSVTIPVEPGDKIFATSFGKAVENGHESANGIRVTFFGEYGVVKTMDPAGTYKEFSANGGYLIAPEGAIAINVAMWNGSDDNELYVLNRDHVYENGTCAGCGSIDPNWSGTLSLSYDDRYDVTGKEVEILDAGTPTSNGDAVVALEGNVLRAVGVGTAEVKINGLPYTITVKKAKINLVMIMGQSNAGNHFANATSGVTCPPGTAYHWGYGATQPTDYTQPSMGFHTPLLAELYAQSVAAGDPVKNVLIWAEGYTSKNGQSITAWAVEKNGTIDTTGTDGAAQMLRDCLAYYEGLSDRYEICDKVMFCNHGTTDHNMDTGRYIRLFTAIWERLKAEGMEYVGFLRVRGAHSLNTPENVDLYYNSASAAQFELVRTRDDMFMASTITENWTGVASTVYSIDISRYLSMMEAYGQSPEYSDSYGNKATFADGILTTTMKELYGSNNKVHYGIFGYGIIGADAAYNMYHALNGNGAPTLVQTDSSGTKAAESIVPMGSKQTLDIEGLNHALSFYPACGSPAGILQITVTSEGRDITEQVVSLENSTYGCLDTAALRSYPNAVITVSYTYGGKTEQVAYTLLYNHPCNDGHDYTATVTPPTCTEKGYTTYTCACGDSYVADEVAATGHSYANGICTVCGEKASPYLQQLPENIIGCTNLYDLLTPVKGYYTATKYDTTNGDVLSVVIPVESGDRISASSFGSVSENMGSANGIRVTYLLDGVIVESLSASSVYTAYTQDGYLTVPEGVNMVCVPWWKPSENNWLNLSQISKDYEIHKPKNVPAQAPTCTENGYTAGEICEICNASIGTREEIPAVGHKFSGNFCTVCGAFDISAFLSGKYVSILGDSISTFNGYSNDGTVNTTIGANGPRYDVGTADTKPGSYCLLESVDDTWWMHFANRNGMHLLVNNSWAGSQVFGGKTADGRVIPAAYLERCVNLHDNTLQNNPNNAPIDPDVIFVYLGINDYNFNRTSVGSGTVDYAKLIGSDGTYVTPATFGEAYGILLHKMKTAYPEAQIFAMTLLPENLYSVDMAAWEMHNAYIRAAADYYGIPVVDLAKNCAITWENYSGYMMDKIHPTTAGMKLISDCIQAELTAYYTENPPHIHSYTATVTPPTCTEKGYTTYTCACGKSYVGTATMDITHLFNWTDGKMISATSGGSGNDKNWMASDYVDISAFDTIVIKTGNTINVNTTLGLAFYDANKKFISGVTHTDGVGTAYGTMLHTLEVPENAVYIRSTWYSSAHPNYDKAFGVFSCTGTGQYTPAAGHNYQLTSTTPPTCTAGGSLVYTCTDCGDSYTESTSRLEHTYDDGVCTVCGVSILGSDWIAPDFAEGDYTMVVLPDSQNLVTYWPEIYYNQMQWIASNKDAMNIQAVLHMGDMVNNNNQTEWQICENGTDILVGSGIPWMPMRGNHDDSDWFNRYYDYATYGTNQSWFGGSFEEGKLDHTYWFVTVGDRKYLILSLGWAPSWDVLDWAQGVVEENTDKSVILTCHAYMNGDGTFLDEGDAHNVNAFLSGYPDGEDIWNAFKDYENVALAMGGHIHSADIVSRTDPNGAGKDVTSLLIDRQNDDIANRYAMVAVLTFHADSNTVEVNWYSTRYDALFREKNQFEIQVPHIHIHSYTATVTPPTFTEKGYTTYTCECGKSYVADEVAATGHSYKATVTKPTCTAEGYTTYTCDCGDSYVADKTPATGHSFGEWKTVKEATCTANGEQRRDCKNCDHYETKVIAATGHSYKATVTKPTCTAEGYTTYTCHCGDSYVTDKTPATDHTFGEWTITKEATCTADGEQRRDCKNCDHYETKVIAATGHSYKATITKPTCTAEGYTTYTCHCGDSYVADKVPATGHSFGEWETTKEATCTVNGEQRRECKNCDHYETQSIPATGHNYQATVTKPTCTAEGYTTYTCHCGDSYVADIVTATGHSFGEWTTTKEATCTANGEQRRECKNCDHFETKVIAATGHSYKTTVTAPTCTTEGFTTYTCHCGDSYVADKVPATGHSFGEWATTIEATCTANGEQRRDCKNCDHYETKVIAATGHNYQATITKPTCTTEGFTTYTCHCGDSYVADKVPATGHSFGEWATTKEATCTANGEQRRNCKNCDHFETKVIAATGHNYQATITKPTCTTEGYTTYTCHCGDSYVADKTPATGHSFGEWETVKDATCTTNGEQRRDCKNCDHFETKVIPATGHSYQATITKPTCTEDGYTTYTCHCGDSYVADKVPATEHSFGEWTTTKEATCTVNGEQRRDCKNCDHFETRAIPATGHSYKATVTKPTCTAEGYTTYTCHCGDSYVADKVPAKGHTFGEWTTTKEATCTVNGEQRRDCANCDHFETKTIAATGHSYTSVVTKPTCTTEGYTTYTCHCGDSYVADKVPATGHSFCEWETAKEATCTANGEQRRECKNCDHYETKAIPATGHSYQATITKPTCTTEGYTTYTCHCGDSYVADKTPATGHTFGEWTTTKEVTCTVNGEQRRDCKNCDHYETKAIPATGHSYKATITKPTCTEDGYTTYTCHCGDSYVADKVPATGHDYDSVVTNPTCTEKGYVTYTCKICGDTYAGNHIPSVGHSWDEGVVTVTPTEEQEGLKVYTCTTCGETKEEILPKLEHVHRYTAVVTDPTCTEQGYTTYTCRCGDTYVADKTPATGHTYGEWTTTKEATCTANGEQRRECANCDHFETRTIAATGHKYDAVVTAPTCTEKGFTTYTCHCGDTYVDNYVDPVGHAWTEWHDTTPGKEERSCTACGETESRDKAVNYDVDGNGTLNQADVELLMSILVGNTDSVVLYDFDFDGILTIYDCVLLMQQLS